MVGMLANKVVKLENESTVIFNHIQNFYKDLNKKNRDYEEDHSRRGTVIAYDGDIRLYFNLMRGKEKGKELEDLTMSDIMISQDDMEDYIDRLCDLKKEDGSNKYVNKSINRKITALKEFLRYLKRKKVLGEFDISYLQLIKGIKERKNHYGALESDEVMQMADLSWQLSPRKGEVYRMLILTSFKTGLRLGELLNLKWKDIVKKSNGAILHGIGKGNKPFEIKVTDQFYNELITINNGQEELFQISENSVSSMMKQLREKMNIQAERQIVFHSIRKAFGTQIWRMTGDIESARRALRHESVVTTQVYLGINHYEIQDVMFMIDKIDDNYYTKVNKDDLLRAISECPDNVKLVLNMKLHELLKGN
jgi:integrase